MKKHFLLATASVLFSTLASGQVGINTQTPGSTLEVVGKIDATSPDGVLVPRFTVTDLSAKDAVYVAPQNGALVFVTSGTGSSGKTSDITGPGFYYYDHPSLKWKALGGASPAFVVTAEQTGDYTVQPTDDFIKLNVTTTGHTLTLPTSGIAVGKKVYVSNIGNFGIGISPLPRNTAFTMVDAQLSGILVYLGGTGNGSWDWVTAY